MDLLRGPNQERGISHVPHLRVDAIERSDTNVSPYSAVDPGPHGSGSNVNGKDVIGPG